MNLPNKLSLARLFLAPVFVITVLYHRQDNPLFAYLPLIVFLTAIITDAIDGYVARRYNQTTRLGVILDPLADKFLLIVAFITLALTKAAAPSLRIPAWVAIIVITRDIFIVMGSLIIYLMFGYIEFKPSMPGKITTVFQMLTILAVLIGFGYSHIVWNTAAVLTVFSGAHYLTRVNKILGNKK